jgi:hypothetical protein
MCTRLFVTACWQWVFISVVTSAPIMLLGIHLKALAGRFRFHRKFKSGLVADLPHQYAVYMLSLIHILTLPTIA